MQGLIHDKDIPDLEVPEELMETTKEQDLMIDKAMKEAQLRKATEFNRNG